MLQQYDRFMTSESQYTVYCGLHKLVSVARPQCIGFPIVNVHDCNCVLVGNTVCT